MRPHRPLRARAEARRLLRLTLLALCALALIPQPAQAQDPNLPPLQLQRFRPATGPTDFITLFGTSLAKHKEWDIGFMVDYAEDPLRIPAGGSSAFNAPIDSQTTLSLMGNIGLFERFEVGVLLPITILQTAQELEPILLNSPRFSTDDLSPLGLNDLRVTGKYRITDILEDSVGVAMIMGLTLPTGTRNTMTSDEGLGFEVIGAADKFVYKGIRVGANLGWRYRAGRRQVRNASIGGEVLWGVAGNIPLMFSRLDGIAEIDGTISTAKRPDSSSGLQDEEVHAALRMGLRYKLSKNWTFTGGAGVGLSNGVGTPEYRLFFGIGGPWVTGGSWGYDYDGDGIYGERDKCPDAVEDFDGFEDYDGCPDPDNDNDGVPDKLDRCDNTPPGVSVGADGCPDDDADGDGIPDKLDKCPEEAEDKDGWQDTDGCPDPDNDGDGIPDVEDKCPNDAETFNSFKDDDGCPDSVKQKDDRVVLARDKLIITEPVYFATNRDQILARSFPILDEVARVLADNPQIKLIRVEGHTDDKGKASYNLKLSQKRAASVRKYLIGKGVARDRLEAVGYGESQPIADNSEEEGRAKNRRVDFRIVE